MECDTVIVVTGLCFNTGFRYALLFQYCNDVMTSLSSREGTVRVSSFSCDTVSYHTFISDGSVSQHMKNSGIHRKVSLIAVYIVRRHMFYHVDSFAARWRFLFKVLSLRLTGSTMNADGCKL